MVMAFKLQHPKIKINHAVLHGGSKVQVKIRFGHPLYGQYADRS